MLPRRTSYWPPTAGLMLILLAPTICRAHNATVTIDEVLAAWKARQEKVATARFELTTQETIHKGAISFMGSAIWRDAGLLPEPEPNPPRAYLVPGTSSVSLDGPTLRYSLDHQEWEPIPKKLLPRRSVEAFNGQLFKYLDVPASGQLNYASAGVRNCKRSESALTFPILPLILCCRGAHPQFFQDLTTCQMRGQRITIAGRPCVALVRDSGPPGQREFFYLDETRNHVLARQMVVLDGQPTWQLQVS
jgi:hypothetical protein